MARNWQSSPDHMSRMPGGNLVDIVRTEGLDGIDISMFESVQAAAKHITSSRLDSFNNAIAINPEKVVRIGKDNDLRAAVKAASINYPDGIGICIALRLRIGEKVARIPGCELWEELMQLAGEQGVPVFILGGKQAVNTQTVDKLCSEMSVTIVGSSDGYFESDTAMIETIRDSGAKIISVAMGTPRQELFIEQCRQAGLTGFFMGVGGTYDVYSGTTERAPLAFRRIGLEWFYRLLCQPSRIFRQSNLIRFVFMVLTRRV